MSSLEKKVLKKKKYIQEKLLEKIAEVFSLEIIEDLKKTTKDSEVLHVSFVSSNTFDDMVVFRATESFHRKRYRNNHTHGGKLAQLFLSIYHPRKRKK